MNGDGVIDEDDKTYSGTGIAKVEANLSRRQLQGFRLLSSHR